MVNVSDRRGFTLVELAVSMVVIGILLGLGMSMVGPLMTTIKVRESKENLSAAVESINSWASGNNRLPEWGNGEPDTTTDEFVEVVSNRFDAWGNSFIYLFDANLFNATPTKDTICGRRSTAISLIDSNNSTIQNVAYVVLSQGDDATTQATLNGTLNSSNINGVVTDPGAATGTITLDAKVSDIARWVTIDELRTKIGCQGAQLKIVNNELPPGNVGSPYSVNIYADGGVAYTSGGKYAWCIQTSMGDVTLPPAISFTNMSKTTNIPFKASCTAAVAVQSDYLIIEGVPQIPVVIGSDGNKYICSQAHLSVNNNKPTSGSDYSKYWQAVSSTGTASTWNSNIAYFPAPSNLLTIYAFDSLGTGTYKTFVLTINPQ